MSAFGSSPYFTSVIGGQVFVESIHSLCSAVELLLLVRLDCNLRVTVASCIVLRRACSGGGEVRWSPADRLHEVVAACCQDGPRADDEHGRPAGGRSRRPRHPPAARPSRRRGVASCLPEGKRHRPVCLNTTDHHRPNILGPTITTGQILFTF